jgi:hypothetical protein
MDCFVAALLAMTAQRNSGERYCAGTGFGAASALCGFFALSAGGFVSSPGGGLAASDEDDVGVQ